MKIRKTIAAALIAITAVAGVTDVADAADSTAEIEFVELAGVPDSDSSRPHVYLIYKLDHTSI